MADGFTIELLSTAGIVGLIALFIAKLQLPFRLALPIVIVRVALPTIYFALYFDGTWTILDDLFYLSDSTELLRQGFNPVSIITDPEGLNTLGSVAGGQHIAYYWWNLLALYLFGEHYYAPCFLNILLSFVTAHLVGRTLTVLRFPAQYVVACQVFQLLHWDIVAWSSVINLKDVLVQCLTAASFFCVVSFIRYQSLVHIAAFVIIGGIFLTLRFYVPILIVATVGCWMASQWNDQRKYLLTPIVLGAAYMVFPDRQTLMTHLTPDSLADGVFRFALTPRPWGIADEYSYLLIPSVCNWCFFLPGLLGAWSIWRSYPIGRLFLIYVMVCVFCYAITEELLGPRQRLQISFVLAWMQFHFLWMIRPPRRSTVISIKRFPNPSVAAAAA